jgi:hypothetical protein
MLERRHKVRAGYALKYFYLLMFFKLEFVFTDCFLYFGVCERFDDVL